jgi:RNA polymerase sigma factor (sigma-70 family)
MTSGQISPVLRFLRTLRVSCADDTPDSQLLQRFVAQRDEAAFAALLRRHGPMVLSTCRRLLPDAHDAEDAFQATFLVLVRKAGSLGRPELLGPWLHGVAYRTAIKVKTDLLRRRARQRPLVDLPAAERTPELVWRDLRPVLDEEVSRLPDKYRAAFVLCYLEGKTNAEAARQLGCPMGTVLSRLARARERLRARLTDRGLTLSAGLLAAALSQNAAPAALSVGLAETTLQAALLVAANQAALAGAISTPVAALTKGVLQAMFLTKLKIAAAVVLAVGVVGSGAGMVAYQAPAAEQADTKKAESPKVAVPEAAPLKEENDRLRSQMMLLLQMVAQMQKEKERWEEAAKKAAPQKPDAELARLRQENLRLSAELQRTEVTLLKAKTELAASKEAEKQLRERPSDPVELRWRFEKDKPFYQEMTVETKQVLKIMGQEMVQNQNQTFFFRWMPKEQDKDGNWFVVQRIIGVKVRLNVGGNEISYDSTKEEGANHPLAFFQALVGREFRLLISPDGRILKVEGREEFAKQLAQAGPKLKNQLDQVLSEENLPQLAELGFSALPNRAVQRGDSWTRKTKLPLGPIGMYATSSRYRYEGKEGDLDKIAVDATVTYQPPGPDTAGGLPFRITAADLKSTDMTGTILFDRAKGRLASSETYLKLEGKLSIDISGKATGVELAQTQKTVVQTSDTDPTAKK